MATQDETFYDAGLAVLERAWVDALDVEDITARTDFAKVADQVFACKTSSYHKAAIIQTLGKATVIGLDARAVQKGEGDDAWNARTFAQKTFVIWNEGANRPFSHSGDPYVSNPLRIPRFDDSARAKARDKEGFDALVKLLVDVNDVGDDAEAYRNLVDVLLALRRFIGDKSVDYPLPKRASLAAVISTVEQYLDVKSGGARLQAIVAAIFASLADAGLKINDIATGHVNSPDVKSGKGGDVEFTGLDGGFSAEVKDRPLTAEEFLSSIEKARVAEVSDIMFVIRGPQILAENLPIESFAREQERQFSSGLNIYAEKFDDFSRLAMSLIGERGRREFLKGVGAALEAQEADIKHKWAWADLVKSL